MMTYPEVQLMVLVQVLKEVLNSVKILWLARLSLME